MIELWTRTKKYYVIDWSEDGLHGPFTFKEAVQWQRESEIPSSIAKIVIDEQGREVK